MGAKLLLVNEPSSEKAIAPMGRSYRINGI
jgi:hypothetical protein